MRVVLDGHRTCGPDGVARPSCRTRCLDSSYATAAPTAAASDMNSRSHKPEDLSPSGLKGQSPQRARRVHPA